jgi:hypothetical protein
MNFYSYTNLNLTMSRHRACEILQINRQQLNYLVAKKKILSADRWRVDGDKVWDMHRLNVRLGIQKPRQDITYAS